MGTPRIRSDSPCIQNPSPQFETVTFSFENLNLHEREMASRREATKKTSGKLFYLFPLVLFCQRVGITSLSEQGGIVAIIAGKLHFKVKESEQTESEH
jgi:hypothetical protein